MKVLLCVIYLYISTTACMTWPIFIFYILLCSTILFYYVF